MQSCSAHIPGEIPVHCTADAAVLCVAHSESSVPGKLLSSVLGCECVSLSPGVLNILALFSLLWKGVCVCVGGGGGR